jgi:AraC family transcriptional regulator
MKWFVFFFFSSLIVFLTTVFFRLGGYKDPMIDERQTPELFFVGKSHLGPYHKINAVITEVEKWAGENRLPCTKTYGEYIDDPRTKDEDRLRSIGGCVLDFALPTDIKLPEGYQTSKRPAGPSIYAQFTGAPSIGPFKVYPAVEEFMNSRMYKQTGSVYEVYEILNESNATTHYYFSFSR